MEVAKDSKKGEKVRMQSKPVKATVVSMEDEARSAPNTPGKSKSRRKDEVTSTPSNTSPTKSNISKENSVIGYVHMLSSPISNKRKTMKYSSLILQTEDKEVDVLLYSPTKRALLFDSERTRTPVKIRKYTYTSDHAKVIINDMAEISHPSPSEYCFQYAELSSKKCMSVKEIPESSEEGDFVSVIGKIANISDTSTVGTRNLKMVEAILLDTTGKIKISMFEENIASVRQGSIYKILNSRVRCWNGAKKLTTTPTSIISQTEDETLKEMAIEDVLTEENDESTLVVPFIKSVEKVEVYSVCLQCSRKLLQATASLIVKCDRCKHSMILSNCQKRISVHFTN